MCVTVREWGGGGGVHACPWAPGVLDCFLAAAIVAMVLLPLLTCCCGVSEWSYWAPGRIELASLVVAAAMIVTWGVGGGGGGGGCSDL